MAYAAFVMPASAAARATTRPRRRGLKLDLAHGDIATDGAGRLVLADPDVTSAEWGTIQLLVERYSALVFSRQIGTEIDAALARRRHPLVEQALTRTATDACTKPSDRISAIRDLVYVWTGNTVEMSLTFVLANGRTHRTTIALSV